MPALRGLFSAMLLLATFAAHGADGLQRQQIAYDAVEDVLNVQVEQASMKAVLSRIALLSGLEILMDPRVERQVSADIEGQSLQRGIKQLVRDLNTVFVFEESNAQGEEPLLVGVHLLPAGETTDQPRLEPLLSVEGEALLRTMTGRVGSDYAQDDSPVMQRWEHRLKQLPSDYRDRVLAVALEQRRKLEQRRAMRAEREERDQVLRHQVRLEQEAIDERLRSLDPARYELRQKRLREIEQSLIRN